MFANTLSALGITIEIYMYRVVGVDCKVPKREGIIVTPFECEYKSHNLNLKMKIYKPSISNIYA